MWILAGILTLLTLFDVSTAQPTSPASHSGPLAVVHGAGAIRKNVHALLIGVDDYRQHAQELNDLYGPQNDIALMKNVLEKRFDIPSSNIRILPNPTHTEIEREFAALQKRVQKGDIVYIHYSGHGSHTPDPLTL